jgi:hypothetical protein
LELFLNDATGQTITGAHPTTLAEAAAAGFRHVVRLGYINSRELGPDSGGEALKQYRHPVHGFAAVLQGTTERELVDAGYEFLRVEGFAGGGDERSAPAWISVNPGYVTWNLFGYASPFAAGDFIALTDEPGEPGIAEFVLATSAEVRWFKELKFYSRDAVQFATVTTKDDDHGPHALRFTTTQLIDARLIFGKARALGVPVNIYELGDLTRKIGRKVTFTWVRDDDSVPYLHRLGWDAFEDRLPDDDFVQITRAPGTPGVIEIELSTSERVSWWKSISHVNGILMTLQTREIEAANATSAVMTIDAGAIEGTFLVLNKAKSLGAHTPTYEVRDLASLVGQRIRLNWLRDNLGDPRRSGKNLGRWYICGVSPSDARTRANALHDGDVITMHIAEDATVPADSVDFRIEAGTAVTWWKELKFVDRLDHDVGARTVDNGRVAPTGDAIRVPTMEISMGTLVFGKAKGLGVLTPMYEWTLTAAEARLFAGRRVTFRWVADDLEPGQAGYCG